MKVLYSKNNKTIDFGNENLEEFVQVLDKQDDDAESVKGKYWERLQNKRIFYVLKVNCEAKLYKIGIAHAPTSRLKAYYNHYGANDKKNHCTGMKVMLILSTDRNYANDHRKEYRNYEINQLETFVKAELKEENLIVRGSEWANVEGWKLQDIIKKHIKNVHGDIITPVKLNTRSANSRYTSRNRSGLVR